MFENRLLSAPESWTSQNVFRQNVFRQKRNKNALRRAVSRCARSRRAPRRRWTPGARAKETPKKNATRPPTMEVFSSTPRRSPRCSWRTPPCARRARWTTERLLPKRLRLLLLFPLKKWTRRRWRFLGGGRSTSARRFSTPPPSRDFRKTKRRSSRKPPPRPPRSRFGSLMSGTKKPKLDVDEKIKTRDENQTSRWWWRSSASARGARGRAPCVSPRIARLIRITYQKIRNAISATRGSACGWRFCSRSGRTGTGAAGRWTTPSRRPPCVSGSGTRNSGVPGRKKKTRTSPRRKRRTRQRER
mmetsp:Transcript_11551/g.48448  ORF Transcript_11551/g.48448 Transcript_11551/m.48448 type:complete len:302 (+) Transcript_11551:331-1236(+)